MSVRFDFPSLFLTHYAFDQFPKINTNYPLYYSTGTSHKWTSHRISSSVLETFSFFIAFEDSLFGKDEMFSFGDSFYCEKTLLSTWKRKEKVACGRVLLCSTWLLVFLSSFPSGDFGLFALTFSLLSFSFIYSYSFSFYYLFVSQIAGVSGAMVFFY